MREKKIGIVGWKLGGNSFGVTLPYLQLFSQFGNVEILMPSTIEAMNLNLDLVVIPGGPDIIPTRYNNVPDFSTGYACPIREHFDKYLLPVYLAKKIPMFGICRGLQTLVVHFGGSLLQNYPHEFSPEDQRGKSAHKVIIEFLNKEIRGQQTCSVNSLHHQVTNPETFPKELIVVARHEKDKSIEAIVSRNLEEIPVAAVQWHPEELGDLDPISTYLINKLLTNDFK